MASRKGIPPKGSSGKKKVAPSRTARPVPTRAAATGRPAPTSPRLAQSPAPTRAVASAPAKPTRPVAPVARPVSPATRPVVQAQRPVPKSVKIGVVMAKELNALKKAKVVSATARIPEQKAAADRETVVRSVRLKKMVDASRAIRGVRKPKKKKISHIEPVASATIKLRQSALASEATQKALELSKLKAERAKTSNPLVRRTLDVAVKQKQEEIKRLQVRHKNLDKGVDVYRPPRISPANVPQQRVSLLLPPAHVKPTKEETEKISRAIIMRTPRRSGESNEKYRARLFALIQRALARFSQVKTQQMLSGTKPAIAAATVAATTASVSTTPSSASPAMLPGEGPQPPKEDTSTGQIIVSIAEQTVAQDGGTVAAEVDAGGVVADSAADAMADTIDQAADTLNAAVAATEGVTGDQLAVEAEGEIAQQLEEDGQTVDGAAVPLYKQPVVIAGAIAALGFYLYKRGVFKK